MPTHGCLTSPCRICSQMTHDFAQTALFVRASDAVLETDSRRPPGQLIAFGNRNEPSHSRSCMCAICRPIFEADDQRFGGAE